MNQETEQGEPSEEKSSGEISEFETPETTEIENEEVAAIKERARQLTQELKNITLQFGADERFVNGEADDEYREGAKTMEGLIPMEFRDLPEGASCYLDCGDGEVMNWMGEAVKAQATTQTAVRQGFSNDPDGTNFTSSRFGGFSSTFFLSADESDKVSLAEDIYYESHGFERKIPDEYFKKLLNSEFNAEEQRALSKITMYPFAAILKIPRSDLPADLSVRLEAVIRQTEALIEQIAPENQELNRAIYHLSFVFAAVSLARLKVFLEKIDQNPDLLPHREQEWGGESHKVYDASDYQTSEEDVQTATEQYLSWMKLND